MEVKYKTHFHDHVNMKLWAIGELYRAFGQVANIVYKKLEIEEWVKYSI